MLVHIWTTFGHICAVEHDPSQQRLFQPAEIGDWRQHIHQWHSAFPQRSLGAKYQLGVDSILGGRLFLLCGARDGLTAVWKSASLKWLCLAIHSPWAPQEMA